MKRIFAALALCISAACTQPRLVLICLPGEDSQYFGALCGYVDHKGDTVVPLGYYNYYYSDTIRRMGFVMQRPETRLNAYDAMIAIDARGRKLFNAYLFDNGPDYTCEGLFRIRDDRGLIGYADTLGQVVVEPQFEAAYPFENGRAQVAYTATTISDGEYSHWESDAWLEIDTRGRRIDNR